MARSKEPSCSTVLLRPLARFVRERPELHAALLKPLDSHIARAGRIDFRTALGYTQRAVELTGDPDLGLRVALYTALGDFEVFEWVATSAETWREACETACRYIRVLNDTADYRIEVHGDKAHLILGCSVPLERAAADFQIAAYDLSLRLRVPESPPELEVCFKHPEPADLSAYRAVFPRAKLVFGAAFDGFVSDAYRLDLALPTANAPLHRALRERAEQLLQELTPADTLIERVNQEILKTMCHGGATAARAAATLGTTRRTLTRQLAQRGTTYVQLLREARFRAAVHHLRHTDHTIEDISFLLGFSECPPFIRAFRRWTGMTPLEYRRRSRRAADPPLA